MLTKAEAHGFLLTLRLLVDGMTKQIGEGWPLNEDDKIVIDEAIVKVRECRKLAEGVDLQEYFNELLADLVSLQDHLDA
jgi:hypothetical protein